MRCARLLRFALAAILASAGVGLVAPAAHAAPNLCTNVPAGEYFWSSEQDMADAETPACRSTYLLDPGRHYFLNRAQVLSQVGQLYAPHGLSRQFIWYAPEDVVTIPAHSPLKSASCASPPYRAGGACDPALVNTNPDHTMSFDFGYRTVGLHALDYGGNAIFLVCGNFTLPQVLQGNGQAPAPVPVIRGTKFNDLNRDQVQDNDEPGIPGWTITLTRVSSLFGDQPAGQTYTTTTGANGSYAFPLNNIGPGTYTVTEGSRDRWAPTTGTARTVEVPSGIGNRTLTVPSFGNYYINHPPVADAGPDQHLDQTSAVGAQVTLDGSGSSDPDGDSLTYTWTGHFATTHNVHPAVTLPVGTWPVTLTVSDGLASDTDTMTVTVYPPITATGTTLHGVEGTAVSHRTVATFTDPDPTATGEEYAATIDWGDGTSTSRGAISGPAGGPFTVTGTHTYTEEGDYPVRVTITDTDNPYNTGTATTPATVDDATISATPVREVLSTNPVTTTELATFTDDNPYGPVTDFTATIDWGDGTPTSQGTITGATGGPFTVTGSHTYGQLGRYTITVTIVDDGGATTQATVPAIIYAPSAFVIGDGNTDVGTQVEFWGAQWANDNTLTSGPAPGAFKGYITGNYTPACDATWTTSPGNSGHPPATIPTYIAVTVTDHVTQTGSTITGDTTHVVIVKTDPGYAGNPGHPGTGTIVATLC
jgi:SdrD B-like domain/PKD domain